MTDAPPVKTRRWPARLGVTLGLLVAFAVLAWVSAPAVTRAVLIWGLERPGTMTAEIGRVEVALRPPALTLHNVRLRPTEGAGAGLTATRLRAALGLRALLEKRILLHDVKIDGLNTVLRQEKSGKWRAGDIPLYRRPRPGAEPPPPKPPGKGPGWQVGVADMAVKDTSLRVDGAGIDQSFRIEEASLGRLFAWAPATETTLSLAVILAGARLDVDGRGHPLSGVRDGSVALRVRDFPLASIAPLLSPAGLSGLAGTMTLDMQFSGKPDGKGGTTAQAGGKLALRDLSATTAEGTLRAAALDWNGRIDAGRSGDRAVAETKADGTLTGRGLLARRDKVEASLGVLNWKGTAELRVDPGRTEYTRLNGRLALDRVRAQVAKATARAASLVWDGWVSGSNSTAADEFAANLRGAATARKLLLDDVADGMVLAIDSAEWKGQGEALRSRESPEVLGSLDGGVSLGGIRVDAPSRRIRLATAERVSASGLFLTLRRTAFVRDAVARGVSLFHRLGPDGSAAPPLAGMAEATADEAAYTPADGTRLGNLRFDGAHLTVTHIGRGRFQILPRDAVDEEAEEDTEAKQKPAAAAPSKPSGRPTIRAIRDKAKQTYRRLRAWPGARLLRQLAQPAFSVKSIDIGRDSRATLVDVTETPRWQATVMPLDITVGALDSAAKRTDTPFKAVVRLPSGGTMKIDGTGQPFIRGLTATIHAHVDRMELPTLSPLTRRHMGLVLRTGRLQGDLELKATSGRVSGNSVIGIDRLAVEIADEQKAAPLTRRVPVSIDKALDFLRDGKGRIELKMPISGNAADPKFDASDVINQAIGNAVAGTLISTLKLLFPVSMLAEAVMSDNAVALAPVPFVPGTARAAEDARAYVAKLHEMLEQRPGVTVALCGKAGPADREALLAKKRSRAAEAAADGKPPAKAAPKVSRAELEALAKARALAARRMIIGAGGVDEARLLRCAPDAETAAEAKPRVELKL